MSEYLEARIAELERRISALEGRPPAAKSVSDRKSKPTPTPREFLLSRGPKSDVDKTLTAGYYIEMISGQGSFDSSDIEGFYAEAKEAAPENRRDPPYQNVKKGYFREVGKRRIGRGARNSWALTNSGIARVESGFMNAGRP